MQNSFENIYNLFNSKNCKLLTNEEELFNIKKNNNGSNIKLNYIAACGHDNTVFYNVFKYRNTGVYCQKCKNKLIGETIQNKMKNNEISKIQNILQENNFIKKLEFVLKNVFFFQKAFDCCKADVVFKPIDNTNLNDFVGVQIKTTKKINLTYSFHLNNNYDDLLILLYCEDNNKLWLFPQNILKNKKKISIGKNKSKYDEFEISFDNLCSKLLEYYNISKKTSFDILNLPQNIYQQREQSFRKFRENILNFLNFEYSNIEGTVYDFKINNKKIQEKIAKQNNNRCVFEISKNNGSTNKNKQYDFGDNDFYWLNSDSKTYFFILPEQILIEQKLIGQQKENFFIKVTLADTLHKKVSWLQPYLFNYLTINNAENKAKLIKMFENT